MFKGGVAPKKLTKSAKVVKAEHIEAPEEKNDEIPNAEPTKPSDHWVWQSHVFPGRLVTSAIVNTFSSFPHFFRFLPKFHILRNLSAFTIFDIRFIFFIYYFVFIIVTIVITVIFVCICII
jgi:hypothetical protein